MVLLHVVALEPAGSAERDVGGGYRAMHAGYGAWRMHLSVLNAVRFFNTVHCSPKVSPIIHTHQVLGTRSE